MKTSPLRPPSSPTTHYLLFLSVTLCVSPNIPPPFSSTSPHLNPLPSLSFSKTLFRHFSISQHPLPLSNTHLQQSLTTSLNSRSPHSQPVEKDLYSGYVSKPCEEREKFYRPINKRVSTPTALPKQGGKAHPLEHGKSRFLLVDVKSCNLLSTPRGIPPLVWRGVLAQLRASRKHLIYSTAINRGFCSSVPPY
uniref:Uncharacterized protein n=1 Tax=Cacopsylla melanoneura TaxID=428564 RepID=A0A8D8ZB94_9HEMI